MQILVTGGTGFTGKRVLPLLQGKADVRVFVRNSSNINPIKALNYEYFVGDLKKPESLVAAMKGCEGLINIASLGFGYANAILESAEKAGIRRALFVSTTAIFTHLPAKTKAIRVAAETQIQESNLDWTILRPTMIYGGRDDRNLFRLIRFLKQSPLIFVPGEGNSLMQPIHVEDLAQAIIDAFFAPTCSGKAYNLSGAHPISFNALIDATAKALSLKRFKCHIPLPPICFLLRHLQKINTKLPLKEEQVLRLAEDKRFDHDDAVRDFGFRTLSFEEGIKREIAELKRQQVL